MLICLATLRREFEVDLSGLPPNLAEDEWFRVYNETWARLERRSPIARVMIGAAFIARALPDRAFAVPQEP